MAGAAWLGRPVSGELKSNSGELASQPQLLHTMPHKPQLLLVAHGHLELQSLATLSTMAETQKSTFAVKVGCGGRL